MYVYKYSTTDNMKTGTFNVSFLMQRYPLKKIRSTIKKPLDILKITYSKLLPTTVVLKSFFSSIFDNLGITNFDADSRTSIPSGKFQ